MTKFRMFIFSLLYFFELVALPALAGNQSPVASVPSFDFWLLLPLVGIPLVLVIGREI